MIGKEESMHTIENRQDDGFGLVEVVVSMLLFVLLALSFVPLLTKGLEISSRNTASVSATQAATSILEEARLKGDAGCAVFSAWLASHPRTPEHGAVDGLGRAFTVSVGRPAAGAACDENAYEDTKVDVVVVISGNGAVSDPVSVPLGGDVHAKVVATVRVSGKVDL